MKKHRKERGWFYAFQIFSISFLAILLLAVNPALVHLSPSGNEMFGEALGGFLVTLIGLLVVCTIALFYLVKLVTKENA